MGRIIIYALLMLSKGEEMKKLAVLFIACEGPAGPKGDSENIYLNWQCKVLF